MSAEKSERGGARYREIQWNRNAGLGRKSSRESVSKPSPARKTAGLPWVYDQLRAETRRAGTLGSACLFCGVKQLRGVEQGDRSVRFDAVPRLRIGVQLAGNRCALLSDRQDTRFSETV